jgi:RNA polymerase sigma factor (sigma-70 family)
VAQAMVTGFLQRLTLSLPEVGDDDLLQRYRTSRDEQAFQEIVRRHGGMVADVCQSVLRNHADRDDAFQATFLILARRAETIRHPAALAAWLHGTAYRTALKARVMAARRHKYEANVPPAPNVPSLDLAWVEVREALHHAIHRLPERVRNAIVLCYLHGQTQDQAGKELGLSKDGIKKRLERGRELLRLALAKRGFGPAALLGASAIALAPVSFAVARSTAALALPFARGEITVSKTLMELTKGSSLMFKVKLFASLVVLAAVTFGTLNADPQTVPKSDKPATAAPMEAAVAVSKFDPALAGDWVVVEMSVKGEELFPDSIRGMKVRFADDRMEVKWPDKMEPLFGACTIVTDPKAKIKSIDYLWSSQEDKDKVSPGIYQIHAGQLKLALRLPKHADKARPVGYATASGTIITLTMERPKPEK